MKKFKFLKVVVVFTFFIGLFIPISNVSAATTSRRLDEVLGEYALSLVGKANDNMREVQKYVGTQLLERFKDRTNELNSILNGALRVEGNDTPIETWDKIVDFVFPVDQEDVKITSTPALKGAIADIIINMPESIEMGNDYTYLGKFGRTSYDNYKTIHVPFQYHYIKDQSAKYIYFKIAVNSPYSIDTAISKIMTVPNENSIITTESIKWTALEDGFRYGYVTLDSLDSLGELGEITYNWLLINTNRFITNTEPVYADVYYSIGEPQQQIITKTDIFNSMYLNKSSNDVYRIINSQYGDTTTVTYNFNQTYNNYDDYGMTPDQNTVSSGDGILGALLEFLGGIPQIIVNFMDALLGLFERIVGLFIPTSEQIADLSDSFSNISANLSSKFKPITDIGNSISSIFASPKSLYDLTITIGDEEINVLPLYLQAQISHFRLVLSGGVVLTTVIELYKRFVGREDLIK